MVDVLIVGTGPAGLALSAQLSAFPDVDTLVVERNPGPLEFGRADGISRRSLEMFCAFGFSDRVLREGCWVSDTTFWEPSDADPGRIVRRRRSVDPVGELSEFPHVIVNQARIHEHFLEVMRRSPAGLEPTYGAEVRDVTVDGDGHGDHPVRVAFADGSEIRARYVVGCDGARSTVRRAIGQRLAGDSTDEAWGVLDVFAVTDFPDVRVRALVQSAAGNLILIPREGGSLIRLYVELDDPARQAGPDEIIAAAQRILQPHHFDVREVVWSSVYTVGQRLCARFDDETRRVFIAGDACHTHSAKAGQGMNVSMQDAFNLGWKLAAVLRGRSPQALLATYSAERQAEAQALIDFDREWSRAARTRPQDGGAADRARLFARRHRFAAGLATRYPPSMICGEPTHQELATGFVIGERFHSAPVTRLADGRPLQLGHVARADGRWRLYAFADRDGMRLRAWCERLDADADLDIRAVFQQDRQSLELGDLPPLLLPRTGPLGLIDYEKAFTGDEIFELRGIDRERGCVVVVRPDQYVAHVLPLEAPGELATFLASIRTQSGS